MWISKKQKSLQISDADISQVSRNNKVVTGAIVSTLQYISQRPWAEGPRCLLRLFRHVRLFASLCSIDAKLNNAVFGICSYEYYYALMSDTFLLLAISVRTFSVSLLSLT